MNPINEKPLSAYQQVILRDVQHPAYLSRQKWVWVISAIVTLIFASLFFVYYYGAFFDNWGYLFDIYRASTKMKNASLQRLIYIYEKMIVFVGFAGVAGMFSVLLFFVFDMQERNALIRRLLEKERRPPD